MSDVEWVVDRMTPAEIMERWQDGDEQSWAEEFAWLDEHEPDYLWKLTLDILANGIKEPIKLGDDWRVWDGHHRMRIAVALGLPEVPVKYMVGRP